MIMLALALPSIAVVSFDHRCATPIPHVVTGRPGSSPHRSYSKQASNAPRQQTASIEIPIASDAPPRHTSRGFLVWALSRRRFNRAIGRRIFFPLSVSLFDLKARFFVPTCASLAVGARRSCQGWPSHQPFPTSSAVARPHLDSFEHDGTLGAIGMTIRGEPAFGRDQSRHNLVSGGSKDPNHDAVIRIGSEAPRRRTHSPFRH